MVQDSTSPKATAVIAQGGVSKGWSELAATSAPVQDEAVPVVLEMNHKQILFPCPGTFQPRLYPKIFHS